METLSKLCHISYIPSFWRRVSVPSHSECFIFNRKAVLAMFWCQTHTHGQTHWGVESFFFLSLWQIHSLSSRSRMWVCWLCGCLHQVTSVLLKSYQTRNSPQFSNFPTERFISFFSVKHKQHSDWWIAFNSLYLVPGSNLTYLMCLYCIQMLFWMLDCTVFKIMCCVSQWSVKFPFMHRLSFSRYGALYFLEVQVKC